MSSTEFNVNRDKLIEWIKDLDNENILLFLNSLRKSESKSDKDWWDNLSKNEVEDINRGLADIQNGETISSSDFWIRMKK